MLTGWTLPQHPLESAVTGCKSCQIGLRYFLESARSRLGLGIVWELWALSCRLTATTGVHESQDWEQDRLDKAAAPVGINAQKFI